ncbi:MAG: DNA polymerase III subunit alpha, partial [Clostridia bacterium]
ELISSGETMGIFQLESEGMRKLMSRLKPTCLEDIIAGISLFRPGPMQFIDVYVDGKHNPQNITYLHPLLEPILNVTYGCMVYQEQVMQIVRELGGFSYGQSDEIRRAMSKKHLNELEEQRQYFIYGKKDDKGNTLIEGCLSKGVSEEIANKIYDQMTDFASYAFNKSHAACYAYVSYQTAYLMRYHKVEFLTAMLNDRITNIDEIKKYIGYAMQSNIEILQPDINKSYADFNVEQGKIRFGLGGIKGIGVAAIDKLVAERGNGEFRSLRDFLERADSGVLNKRLVENLIKGGAFDCFNEPRAQMMANYAIQMDRVSDEKKKREQGQFSFFDSLGVDSNFDIGESVAVKEYDAMYKLSLEKEVLGMYVSGSPLEGYKDKFKEFTFTTAMLNTSPELDEDQKFSPTINLEGKRVSAGGILYNLNRITTRAGKQMASAVLEDLYGTMELVFFPKVYDTCKDKIKEDALVTIYGNLSLSDTFGHKDEEEESEPRAKITVDRVDVWESNLTQKVATTTLYIKMQERNDDSYAKASAILEHYTGDLSVILVLGKQKFSMPQKVRECNGIL